MTGVVSGGSGVVPGSVLVVGGGEGTSQPVWKASTGCSSIPFGATPRWRWIRSKNATPVSVTQGGGLRSWYLELVGGPPNAATRSARAASSSGASVDWARQDAAGNSAIIVAFGSAGSASARCTSESASILSASASAWTR